MSTKYPGGLITKNPVTPAGPYQSGAAPGVWTVEQALQYTKQGIWPIAGNSPPYIEDVFSTYLYSGTSAAQTITNGIDLAGKGGLVWSKGRNLPGYNNCLMDTARSGILFSDTTQSANDYPTDIQSYNANGFTLKAQSSSSYSNIVGTNYASWTFRKQPKFFDVVTYTGDGTSNKSIAHSLGSVPGCVIIKLTSSAGSSWQVWHRGSDSQFSSGGITGLQLDLTDAGYTTYNYGASLNIMAAQPTSTNIYVKNPSFDSSACNASGSSYVAYIFAHNAGGFGLTGTDNVISCGSYTGNGSTTGPVIDLGYEPQWLLVKRSSASGDDWILVDNMRGFPVSGNTAYLNPNNSFSESSFALVSPTATGFQPRTTDAGFNGNGSTYIYIAIRRGPMKVPTSGTSVFGLNARSGTGANATVTGSAGVSDAVLIKNRGSAVADLFSSRLTGTGYLVTSSTAAEVAAGTTILQANPWDVMDGVKVGTTSTITNASSNTFINYLFDRAPSFFDEVCYTGTGANQTLTHNLQAIPELIISKSRSSSQDWGGLRKQIDGTYVFGVSVNSSAALQYGSGSGFSAGDLNLSSTTFDPQYFENSTGSSSQTNNTSGQKYVAYLFATCAGVSKVGNYTGTGATQTISCGFTGGARFVLVKRTDSTGDWYVWDTARGMVSGTDPNLQLNSTNAESNANSVYTTTGGFQIVTTDASVNASGGSYIFLAIA